MALVLALSRSVLSTDASAEYIFKKEHVYLTKNQFLFLPYNRHSLGCWLVRLLTGGINCAGARKSKRTSKNKAAVHKAFEGNKNNNVQIQLQFHSRMGTQSAFIGRLNNVFRAGSNICETSPLVFQIWHTLLSFGSRKGKERENTQIVWGFGSNPVLFAVKCGEMRSWWVEVANVGVKRL